MQFNRPYNKLYRIGGEEFMILCPKTALEDAKIVAQRIRELIENYKYDNQNITISLGICEYKAEYDFDKFYKKVDIALYSAKENGRNRVEACS